MNMIYERMTHKNLIRKFTMAFRAASSTMVVALRLLELIFKHITFRQMFAVVVHIQIHPCFSYAMNYPKSLLRILTNLITSKHFTVCIEIS